MTSDVGVTKKSVLEKLELVLDPEMNISIVDLGLIYEIKIKKKHTVQIIMTLTTMGCPLFGVIEDDMYLKLSELNLKRSEVEIEVTFEPPWEMSRMSKRARAMMGI